MQARTVTEMMHLVARFDLDATDDVGLNEGSVSESVGSPYAAQMTRGCIAIVDDEEPVRAALGRLLRLADFDVLGFESGQAFIDSLAQHVPNCVLLDVQMPGMSGLEAQLRLQRTHPLLPIIVMTADEGAVLECRAIAGGASAFLRKLFSNVLLLQAINSALAVRS